MIFDEKWISNPETNKTEAVDLIKKPFNIVDVLMDEDNFKTIFDHQNSAPSSWQGLASSSHRRCSLEYLIFT